MSKCGLFGCSGKRPVRGLVARGLFGFFVNISASARPPASLLAAGVLVVALLSGAGTAGAQAPSFSSSSPSYTFVVGTPASETLPQATGGGTTRHSYNLYNTGTTTNATLPDGLRYDAPNWQQQGDGTYDNTGAEPGGIIRGTPTAVKAETQYDLVATGALLSSTPFTIKIEVIAAAPSFGSASALGNKVYAVGQIVSESLPVATGGTPSLSYAFYNAGTTTTATLPDGLRYDAPTDTSTGGTITGTATAAKLSACYALTVSDSESTPRTATFNNVVCIAVAQPETEAPPSPTQQPPPAPSEPEEPASPAEEPRTVDLMPEFVPNTFAAQNYEQDVRISPVALPGARGGDAPLRYGLSPALPDGLSFDEATRVVSGTPAETMAATVYTLTATDADGDAATLTFTITVEPGASAERALGEINRAVMPELARSMTSSALDAVAGRIEDATSAAGGGKTAARPAVRGYYGIPSEETYDVPAGLSREALGDMSFSVSLAGGGDMDDFPAEVEDAPPGEPGRIAVWAVGDYGRLSGKQSMIDYKGGVFAGHLGTDVRLGPDFVIGVAASWFEGSFDYTDGRSETAVDGEIKSRMTGFYPYMSWSLTEAFSMWAAAGWGFGEIKIEDKDISGRQKSDAIMRTGAAGGKLRLISKAGAFSGGLTTVDLKGEAWLTRLNVESNDDRIEGLTTDVNRLRLAMRGAHELSLRSGSSITPSLEFGVRRDGGDGETGFGAELGGRLAYFSPALGLTVEMNGRGLLAHEGDNKNWALGGGIRYDRGADRRGLSFSMLPSYGETESRVRELWERGVTGDDAGGGDLSFGLDTEVGYGFAALGGQGLLTPYGGVAPRYGDGRSYRLGSRLEIGRRLDLRLEGERLERDAGQSGHELILSGRMNW